jgi:predicted PhzF superfamily epimerase YddE/YHI9
MPPILQIDAFSARPFGGNPAGVCLLERAADPGWMQHVAAEMNLAETAFLVPREGGFDLRWFTPTVEIDLCGHATLASAHALWQLGRVPRGQRIAFETRSGTLTAEPEGDRIAIELPARPVVACAVPDGLLDALGGEAPILVSDTTPGRAHGNLLVEFADQRTVRGLAPRFDRLRGYDFGVIATARGAGEYDFISRYFAAPYGIDEDPVTGSAHCSLAPYWADRLGKTCFVAWQASARGGELHVTLAGDRVRLSGHAVTVFTGELLV